MSINLASFYNSNAKKDIYINKRQYEHKDKEVRDLLSADYFNKINTRPVYQRRIRWKFNAMNSFVGSVFNCRYIQPILMYKLHPEDLTANNYKKLNGRYNYEVMDGQHRLYTLAAFCSAKKQRLPHISKEFVVHWVHEVVDDNGYKNKNYIFYEETEDVKNWCRETGITPQFLSEEGKEFFVSTNIKVTTITSRLTINERRQEFMSLQNGVPVRNSDLLKNMTDCKFVESFEYNDAEILMEKFFSNCSRKASNYWTQWICRCFLLFKRFKHFDTVAPVSDIFLFTDTYIQKIIKTNHTLLNPSETEITEFYDIFNEFIEFLQSLSEDVIFNPTQIFALFYHLCHENRNIEILSSHMNIFSKAGQRKDFKNMWEGKERCNNEMRIKYLNECIEELNGMELPAIPIDDRPISAKLKEDVWKKCINGMCAICEDNVITECCFEAGHIKARSFGGQTEIDNLLPMCMECNRYMGTRNALEYKKDKFPLSRLYLHLY
jgi:hypothetical protein